MTGTIDFNDTWGLIGGSSTCQVNGSAGCVSDQPNQCKEVGGNASFSDPIRTGGTWSTRSETDVDISGALSSLTLERTFSNSPDTWQLFYILNGPGDGFLPKPFGSTPSNASTLEWTHQLYAFVYPESWAQSIPSWFVRTAEGEILQFQACTLPDAGACSAYVPSFANSSRAQLNWSGGSTDAGSFTLIHANGRREVYSSIWVGADGGTPHYFLTSIQDVQYADSGVPRMLVQLTYDAGSVSGCPGLNPGSMPGVPYVSTATSFEGAQLVFEWEKLSSLNGVVSQECVLKQVDVVDRDGGAVVPWVTYAYDGGNAGLLASITYPATNKFHGWTYPTSGSNSITFSEADSGVSAHSLDSSGHVTSEADPYEALSLARVPGACPGDYSATWCLSAAVRDAGYTSALSGDGSGSSASFSRAYVSEWTSFANGPRTYQAIDSCGTNTCSPGTQTYEWTVLSGGTGADRAVGDKRGNWTAYTLGEPASAPQQEVEVQAEMRGAAKDDGTGALETTNHTYAYGPLNQEQLPSKDTQTSVLNPSGDLATTQRNYESTTDRLASLIRQGYTKTFSSPSWSTAERWIGTFYFTNQPCSGGGTPDAYGRTLEVHGPCLASSLTASDCTGGSTGGVVPITQFTYYGSSAAGNAAKRLEKISRFTNNSGTSCSGSAHVDVTFNAYDLLGNPTSITDEAGVTATYTYEEHRAASRTVGSNTWKYGYDNEKLTTIQNPTSVASPSNGLYEVFCYRNYGSDQGNPNLANGCPTTSGTWNERLQWKAKYSSTSFSSSTWTEAVFYTYWGDGTLKSESYQTNNGGTPEPRRVKNYAADAHQRPTYEKWGDATGSFTAARGFDGADNLALVGLPYDSPPSWCMQSGTSIPSYACAWLINNRANRLSKVDEFPDGGSGSDIVTCLDHDGQGNIMQVCTGESGSQVCVGYDGGPSSCSNAILGYQYDDFGNVVGATLPWTNNGSGAAGTTLQQFDALGDVVTKQTPQMAANSETLQYAFDSLGRLTSATDVASTNTTLYTLQYDTPDTAHDPTCFPQLNTGGRLANRFDSTGETWYSYDSFGNLAAESTDPAPANRCPITYFETLYSYNADEALTSIQENYGRQPSATTRTTSYLLSATDRVSAVWLSLFTDAGVVDAGIISAVAWEPYGGLRGYQINTLDGGPAAVEYMLGDDGANYPGNGGSSPTSCGFAVASKSASDHTGRLRTLVVSPGTFSPPLSDAGIYEVGYRWQGDQLVETDTCLLDAGVPRTERFGYDQMLRLTSASNPSTSTGGGAFSTRAYSYSSRSNLSGETLDSCTRTPTYSSSPFVDTMSSTGCCGTCDAGTLDFTYGVDDDGRATSRSLPADSTGAAAWFVDMTYGVNANSADDTVFHSVQVGNSLASSTYSYYTDAFGRRSLKVYPVNTVSDKYVMSADNNLLMDQGNDSRTSPAVFPDDEYVWLGGRPVAVVRGRFDTSWNRQYDLGATGCSRYGDDAGCGLYFPVTDQVGKPVLMLDSNRLVAGEASYDPQGYPNRVFIDAETSHPYNFASGNVAFGSAKYSQSKVSPAISTSMRAVFDYVDTFDNLCTIDNVAVEDGNTSSVLWTGPAGAHGGRVVSPWVTPSQGSGTAPAISLEVEAPATTCSHFSIGCHCYVCQSCTTSGSPYGAVVSAYEYERYQPGSTPYWVPLRFAGQYYDAETDLFENWNRYYDPSIGRYLEADPMLVIGPNYALARAKGGIDAPVFAYANNNLNAFVDVDGTNISVIDEGSFELPPGDPNSPSCAVGSSDLARTCYGKFSVNVDDSCHKNPDCTWSFDVRVIFDTIINYRSRVGFVYDKVVGALIPVGQHEGNHVGDINSALSQLNQIFTSDEFGSEQACEDFRKRAKENLESYGRAVLHSTAVARDLH